MEVVEKQSLISIDEQKLEASQNSLPSLSKLKPVSHSWGNILTVLSDEPPVQETTSARLSTLKRFSKSSNGILDVVPMDPILIDAMERRASAIEAANIQRLNMEIERKRCELLELKEEKEAMESNDNEIFPGFHFQQEENEGAERASNETPNFDASPVDYLNSLPEAVYQSLQAGIVAKYSKGGTLSKFRGVKEVAEAKARSIAKRRLEYLHQKAQRKRAELYDIEGDIVEKKLEYRNTLESLEILIDSITNHLEANPSIFAKKLKLKVTKTQPLDFLSGLIVSDLPNPSAKILSFKLPQDQYLLIDKRYSELHDNFMDLVERLVVLLKYIPKIEYSHANFTHVLSELEEEEEEVSAFERDIKQEDFYERLESLVVEKCLVEINQKRDLLKSKNQSRKEQQIKIVKENEHKRQAELVHVNRDTFKKRLAKTIEERSYAKEMKNYQIQENIRVKTEALEKLSKNCKLIRARIAKHTIAKQQDTIVKQHPDKVSIQDLIRQKKEQTQKLQDRIRDKKMAILKKIIDEEDRRKLAEKKKLEPSSAKKKSKKTPGKNKFQELRENTPILVANIQEKAEESKLDQELPVNNATVELSPIKRRPLQRPKKVRSPLPNQTNIMDLSNPPFKSSTPFILFAEYEPGKTYTQTVKFTNISSYVNCYKILPLSLELEQVFEIIWSPPGKLSGGMAGPEIKIVFNPPFEYNDDLVGELYGQAEFGGNFCVGLECRKKSCQPRIDAVNGDHMDLVKYDENLCNKQVERISKDTCKVNFGANIVNGVTLRRIHIVNDGSLESEYNVYTCDEFIASQKVKELPFEIVDVNSNKSTPLADQSKSENLESVSTANIPGVNKLEESIEAKVEAVLENEAGLTKQRQEKSKLFKVSKSAGILSSSGKITIDIHCCPTEFHKQTRKEDFTMTFVVAFKGTDISPIIIECEATLVPSQISTFEEQVDFGMCIAGSIYKKTISVQNKGSRSVKLAVEVGKEHRKYQIKSSNEQQSHDSFFKPSGTHLSIPDVGDIEISPKIGFAQIKDPFSLSINFRPKKLMQNNSTALEPNPKEISIPISLKYKSFGIEMAIPIKINSTITTDSVSFELPKETSSITTDDKTTVDFGTCSMYQSCETAIKVINHSHLIQKVKFTSSSPSLLFDIPGCSKIHSTENDETYYFLDPLITVSALVSFEPNTNKKYSMSLQCSGDSSQHFKIVFKGESLRPLLKFENNEITFSPTSLGSYSIIKTFLLRDNNKHNGLKTDAKIGFRFEEPKIIGLSVKDTDGKTKDIDLSLVEGQEGVKFQQPASMTKIAKPPVERMSTGRKLSDNPIQIEAESSANGNTNQPYHYSKSLPIPVEISPKAGFVKIQEKYPIDIKVSPKLDLEEVKRAIITRLEKLKTNERAYNQACDEAQKREVKKKEKGIIASKEKKGAAAKEKENKPIEQVEEVALLPPVKELDPPINYFEDFQDTTITILVPCFIRIEKSEKDRMALLLGAVPDKAEEEVQVPLICLKLIVPITSPSFVIVSLENRHPLKKSFDVQEEQTDDITSLLKQAKVDFGQVPIGQKLIQIIKLRNTLNSPITLHSSILNPQGPFYLVKALRQIPPLQAYDLKLSFEPAKPGKLKTQYTIYTEETQVLLELAGEGVSPMMQLKLKIDADEVDGDTIRFGDVPIGELNEKTFVLRNPCHFPILCGFQVNTRSYKISPEEVIIQPYAKQDISVTFCPYSEDDCINDNVQLKYWGQSEIQGLRLLGRGWETTSAVVGYDDPIPVIADDIKEIEVAEEVLDTETEEPKIDESRQRSASTVSRKSEVKSSLKYVTVACDWSKHEEAEEVFWSVLAKEIGIANLKVTTKQDKKIGGKQPPVSFTIEKINNLEFDIDPESGKLQVREKEVIEEDTSLPHFEMEPMSGTVEVGSTKPITIKCVVGAAQIEKKEVSNKKKQVGVVNTSSGREKMKEATQVVGYFRVALKGGFNLERKMVNNEKREWIVKVYTRTK